MVATLLTFLVIKFGAVVCSTARLDIVAHWLMPATIQLAAEKGRRDPATESQFDYGSRAAIWRIMKLFKQHNIPITFYAVGRSFERNTLIPKYAEENGHEVAAHCYKVCRAYCTGSLADWHDSGGRTPA